MIITLGYTKNPYKQEGFKETTNDIYEIFLGFETNLRIQTYALCWLYNDDTQQECIGIITCAIYMLNASPTCKMRCH